MTKTPTVATEMLLRLSPLHVVHKEEAQVGIYRLTFTQQWKLKSTNTVTPKNLKIWSINPSNRWGLTGYFQDNAYDKPLTIKFPDKSEWQNGFNLDNKTFLVWFTDKSKTKKDLDAGV